MNNQRHQFRMPVSRRGLVILDKTTALCEVMDITEQGLHFSTVMPLALYEKVRIECQLDEDCIIHCGVEHQQQLAMFIQRLILTSLAAV